MKSLSSGRWNLSIGLLGLAAFMVYGFVLIYLRDFAPGHEQWAADYGIGKHFEARLAHVHGALFSVLNLVMGLVVSKLNVSERSRGIIAGLAIAGLLMPTGILAEVLFGAPPILVLVGGLAILVSFAWAGVAALKAPST
ncbi:MAG: hypothetical protein H6740_25930 [Alphaproteobacteria bacterium]|nr:hypothetical protein [Alphaproteobacteria bacterium]